MDSTHFLKCKSLFFSLFLISMFLCVFFLSSCIQIYQPVQDSSSLTKEEVNTLDKGDNNPEENHSLDLSVDNAESDYSTIESVFEESTSSSTITSESEIESGSNDTPGINSTESIEPGTSDDTQNSVAPPAHTHSFSSVVTSPTCTTNGYTTYTCSCGEQYVDNYTPPSHNFINYVCSMCGEIDKSNAIPYLKQWLKTNGEQAGDSYGKFAYYQVAENRIGQYSIMYVPSTDELVLGFATWVNDINQDGYSLVISSSGNHSAMLVIKALGGMMSGTIPPSYQRGNTLMINSYTGPSEQHNYYYEYFAHCTNETINWFGYMLKGEGIKLTIQNFGFQSFLID